MKSNTYKHAWIPTDEMVPENPGKYLVSARRMKGEKFESMILDYGSPVNEQDIRSQGVDAFARTI